MPRTCTICRHLERHAIEAELRASASYRDIARRHAASKDAIARHHANHMHRLAATELAVAANEILKLLDKAETSPSWNATILTIREARQCYKNFSAILTGQNKTNRVGTRAAR